MSQVNQHAHNSQSTTHTSSYKVGCVSFLNSKPLIEGVDDSPICAVRFDVPSHLLNDLLEDKVDIALCPAIDYFRSPVPFKIVPVGGICSEGYTFTVRLYSQIPIEQITTVYVDNDSHTSVALLQILLGEIYHIKPKLIDYHAREHVAEGKIEQKPQAMLLIGDKVVTDSPLAVEYPHQMDLGQAWNNLTGLPFMFAVWMAKEDRELGDLPKHLDQQRQKNAQHINEVSTRYAAAHGWPKDLTRKYFTEILDYKVSPRHLQAMGRFGQYAQQYGLIEEFKELVIMEDWN